MAGLQSIDEAEVSRIMKFEELRFQLEVDLDSTPQFDRLFVQTTPTRRLLFKSIPIDRTRPYPSECYQTRS